MNRYISLSRLRDSSELWDILIIGGGATGLGAAVDAAARGYRVALVERGDFAAGTSSRSTKLVHGGVRYLRQGNVSLVLEALRERGRLARNAPHLVRDLSFAIPCYRLADSALYGIGMKVYDRLAGKWRFGRSESLSRGETEEMIPNVETSGLRGGVLYHDGQFDDTRLAVNLAQTADDLDAVLANYCECVRLSKSAGRISGAIVRDLETGAEFEVHARVVINATGVFTDGIRQLDDPVAPSLVTVSQGIHLVLPRSFFPGDAAMMIPKTVDGRVLFAVPWHGCVVVGTTDTPVPAATREPRATAAERDFVLQHARKYLVRDPSDGDVLSVFAGLRPLVRRGSTNSTAGLSRDHTIVASLSGLVTVTGGKWTTYRKMGADVVDWAERVAHLDHRPTQTETLSIHGATKASRDELESPYGSDRAAIESLIAETPALGQPLHARLPYRAGEVVWHARREMARTVEDVLARRTRALLLDARASIEAAPRVAQLLAQELRRDAAWEQAQIDQYSDLARGYVFGDPASVMAG